MNDGSGELSRGDAQLRSVVGGVSLTADELGVVALQVTRWHKYETRPKGAVVIRPAGATKLPDVVVAALKGQGLPAESAPVLKGDREELRVGEKPSKQSATAMKSDAGAGGVQPNNDEGGQQKDNGQKGLLDRTTNVAGVEKRVTSLAELNDRFALLETPRSATAYISRADNLPIKDDDLRRRLAGEVVQTGVKDDKPIYVAAYTFWTGHARRHRYRRIVFANQGTPTDTLNLFRGFGVKPRAGRCDLILAHIREVICSSDEISTIAMLKLMAWQMQNVGKPSRVIVIMKTKEHQAGKGLVLGELLLPIYGPSGFIPAATDQVTGRFNDAIVGRVYMFLDEVMFSGDKRAADAIKRLSTTTLYGIEAKNLPVIQCPVAVNFWAATNHPVAAFIEEADVRYWVLDVSEHRVGDTAYFNALVKEIENGGREAFAHYLLNLDVTGFVPQRDVPKNNAAKAEMVRRSINPFDARKWLEECCLTRQLIGCAMRRDQEGYDVDLPWRRTDNRTEGDRWAEWVAGDEYPFHVFSNAYKEWQKGVKSPVAPEPTPIGSLGEVLKNAGFGSTRDRKARYRVLPDPDECLAQLYELKKPPSA